MTGTSPLVKDKSHASSGMLCHNTYSQGIDSLLLVEVPTWRFSF